MNGAQEIINKIGALAESSVVFRRAAINAGADENEATMLTIAFMIAFISRPNQQENED